MLVIFDALKTILNGYEVFFSKKIKSSRGNMEQNNPDADDYIKNRTHWKEEKEIAVLPEQEIAVLSSLYAEIPSSLALVEGESYTVTFNGVQYNCVAYSDSGAVCIGDIHIVAPNNPAAVGNNEPFVIAYFPSGNTRMYVAEQGMYEIEIQKHDVIYHQLDPKYIPDALPTATEADNDKILTIDNGTAVWKDLPKYTGEITVTPQSGNVQTLETSGKYLENDIQVESIPVYEVSNSEGGVTLIIGNESMTSTQGG